MRKSPSNGRPPSDFARLELFCELVDEYDDLAKAFPITQRSLQLVPVATEPAADRWARVVRAMALRKFVLGSGDQVYVPRVLASVEKCLTDPTLLKHVHARGETFKSLARTITIEEGSAPSEHRTAPEVIEDFIYGGLLHGDYDRHERVKVRPDATHDVALWDFITDVEPYIWQLRNVIRRSIADGTLVDAATNGEA